MAFIEDTLAREKARRKFIDEAVKQAAVELGQRHREGLPTCDITYLQGAMWEADQEFEKTLSAN